MQLNTVTVGQRGRLEEAGSVRAMGAKKDDEDVMEGQVDKWRSDEES